MVGLLEVAKGEKKSHHTMSRLQDTVPGSLGCRDSGGWEVGGELLPVSSALWFCCQPCSRLASPAPCPQSTGPHTCWGTQRLGVGPWKWA